ncbi:hypothetical protein GCM10027589_46400 [Actinocorallia lasiicapitis]
MPAAVVAGDPCYDRILASVDDRAELRRSLGVTDAEKLILVSSTWGAESLYGTRPDLIADLLAELPMDRYRVAAALHPNIWNGHGPRQIRSWLSAALRSGLLLFPPHEGWRAGLIAADLVVGDHGSVTFYAAALDRPVLLSAFPHHSVDPASPVAELGRTAPSLARNAPLRPQIDQALSAHVPGVHAKVTSSVTAHPGRSAALLRTEIYRLLSLPEPPFPPVCDRLPTPVTEGSPPTAALVSARWDGRAFTFDRRPAPVSLHRRLPGFHLSVSTTERERRLLNLADVLHSPDPATDPTALLASHPAAVLAATPHPHGTLLTTHDSQALTPHPDPALAASAAHTWLTSGHPLTTLPLHPS